MLFHLNHILFAIYTYTNSCQSSRLWKEVKKDAIQWPVCNQDDKIVQKVCDVVLLRHPEGFLVGGKQQPGTSSHPHPSRLLAPDPLIRVSVITPPALPGPPPLCPLPKTEIALSTQDSNSQHRGSPQKITPLKSFCSLSPHQATPLCVYVPAFSKMSVAVFFCWCCALANPWLVGELSSGGYLCTQTSASLPQPGARNTCAAQTLQPATSET